MNIPNFASRQASMAGPAGAAGVAEGVRQGGRQPPAQRRRG
ncbi:MAG: hypothetical protein U1F77_13795 [Kiritimatiellia bacterium]